MLQLAPWVSVHIRPDGGIQFGRDATTAGALTSFDPQRSSAMATVFRAIRQPTAEYDLYHQLCAIGLEIVAAQLVTEDLISYGILAVLPEHRPSVYVVGSSTLTATLVSLCSTAGLRVHRPGWTESTRGFVARMRATHDRHEGAPGLLVLADQLPHTHVVSDACVEASEDGYTVLTVDVIDGCCHIGPLRCGNNGPCPLCMELHRVDADPQWGVIMSEGQLEEPVLEPISRMLSGSIATAIIRQICGMPSALPGYDPRPPDPGTRWIVSATEIKSDTVEPHPRCPACYRLDSRTIARSWSP